MNQQAFDATTQHHLHDLAKAEAERLHRQALRSFCHEVADDFWRGADVVYQRCQEASHTLAERSATRLQARLVRRARNRVASFTTMTTGA
jgi:regulator of sigma D